METLLGASFIYGSVNNEEFKEACYDIEEAYGIDSGSLSAEIGVFCRKECSRTGCKFSFPD